MTCASPAALVNAVNVENAAAAPVPASGVILNTTVAPATGLAKKSVTCTVIGAVKAWVTYAYCGVDTANAMEVAEPTGAEFVSLIEVGVAPGAVTLTAYAPDTPVAVAVTAAKPLALVTAVGEESTARSAELGPPKLTVTPAFGLFEGSVNFTCNCVPNAVLTSVVWLSLAGVTVN